MVNRSPPRVPDARGSIHCTGAACCDHPKRIRHAATWHRVPILLGYAYNPHTSIIQANPLCVPAPSLGNFDVGSSQNCQSLEVVYFGYPKLGKMRMDIFPHTFD